MRSQQGRGEALYIGSGLEAIYAETLNEELRTDMGSLLATAGGLMRWGGYQAGLMAQYATSEDAVLLHLLADRGSIWEEDAGSGKVPADDQPESRIREKLGVKGVSLLWEGGNATWPERGGWVEVTIPGL